MEGKYDNQEIGRKDVNDIEIKEGDYVEFEDDIVTSNENGTEYDTFRNIGVVRFDYDYMCFEIYSLDSEENHNTEVWDFDVKILGNELTHEAIQKETDFETYFEIKKRETRKDD